jgi:hypothetical protein
MEALRAIEFATYNEDKMTSLTTFLVFFAALVVILLPRRYAIVPVLAVACFVHYEQRLVIGGLDFDMRRLMLLFAMVRVVFRREVTMEVNQLDKLAMCQATLMAVVPVLLNPSQLVWSFGAFLDNVLGYVILKAILQERGSIGVVASWLAVFSIPISLGMMHEVSSERNLFYVFGAPEGVFVRDGEIRASAGFDHPILAGTFGGIVFPLAFVLWARGGVQRLLSIVAVVTSFVIVYKSKSSGPLYGFLGGVLGILLWSARRHISRLRNGLWISLIILQILMKAPVYAVIFRLPEAIGLIGGSTSYHRYMIIDTAIRNIGQWWLLGTSSSVIGTWGYGAQDVTNQYVAVGYASGLLGVVFFILVMIRAFSMTGGCVRRQDADILTRKEAWALGSLLFMHLLSFLGVNYFSGFWFFWTLTIAMISTHCGAWVAESKKVTAPGGNSLKPQPAG